MRGKRIGLIGSLALSLLLLGSGAAAAHSGHATAAKKKKSKINLTALPLGDGRVTSTGPRKNYVFSCQANFGGGAGAATNGPWIHGSTWDYTAKYVVDGAVSWPGSFSAQITGASVRLAGNGLPTNHTTGVFPISQRDDAYLVDRNPNTIRTSAFDRTVTTNGKPATATCLSMGAIGYMTSGVALFNALDAAGQDAAAHEVQDSCGGHPQQQGTYHYHALPPCIDSGKKGKHSGLIGWALDGFPIYGPRGDGGEHLSNKDLDVCHGRTDEVKYNGRRVRLYHYVANYAYPYTLGCYRGNAVSAPGPGAGVTPPAGAGPPAAP